MREYQISLARVSFRDFARACDTASPPVTRSVGIEGCSLHLPRVEGEPGATRPLSAKGRDTMSWTFSFDDPILHRIERHLTRLESMMSDAQAHLDSVGAAITEAVGNVVTEIAALKDAVANGTPLDFTALDASVQALDASTDVVESGETPPVAP